MSHEEVKEYDSPFFHLELPKAKKACECCDKRHVNLSQCANCKVVFYCSRDCQKQDWEHHKVICKQIVTAAKTYKKEEESLTNCDDNFEGIPIDYFAHSNYRTNFWTLVETREFCRAVGLRVGALTKCDTEAALKEGVHLAFKLLYHNRSDSYGMRTLLTPILLRLGMYQEAFDMMKWYEDFPDNNYDWGDQSLPFLSYWKTDRSEAIQHRYTNQLTFLVGEVFVKHQLLITCRDKEHIYTLILASKRRKTHSLTLLQGNSLIFRHIFSYLIGDQLKHVKCKDPAELDLVTQNIMLKAEQSNHRIWRAIVNPKPLLSQRSPTCYRHGSAADAYFVLKQYVCLFPYIPKTIRYIHRFCKNLHGSLEYEAKFNDYDFD